MNNIRYALFMAVLFTAMNLFGQSSLVQQEYWIDNDMAHRHAVCSGATIDLSTLAIGMHAVTVRVQDSEGLWSSPVTQYFVMGVKPQQATVINQCDYWMDNDMANRQTVSIGATIDLSALAIGLHSITVRAQDDMGLWSSPMTQYFVMGVNTGKATGISQCEYWLDSDIGNRQNIASGSTIDLSTLTVGMHAITVRAQDDMGLWSSPMTQFFVVPVVIPEAEITQCYYWFDDQAEEAVKVSLNGSSDIVEIENLAYLRRGDHTLTWMVGDSNGHWSQPVTETFFLDIPTGIGKEAFGMKNEDAGGDDQWYTLTGHKLNKRPTATGIYLHNGKKVIVKN